MSLCFEDARDDSKIGVVILTGELHAHEAYLACFSNMDSKLHSSLVALFYWQLLWQRQKSSTLQMSFAAMRWALQVTLCQSSRMSAPFKMFKGTDHSSKCTHLGMQSFQQLDIAGAGNEAFCSGGDQGVRGVGGYVGSDSIPRLNVLDLQVGQNPSKKCFGPDILQTSKVKFYECCLLPNPL